MQNFGKRRLFDDILSGCDVCSQAGLAGKTEKIFGNMAGLVTWHRSRLLPALQRAQSDPRRTAAVFIGQHSTTVR